MEAERKKKKNNCQLVPKKLLQDLVKAIAVYISQKMKLKKSHPKGTTLLNIQKRYFYSQQPHFHISNIFNLSQKCLLNPNSGSCSVFRRKSVTVSQDFTFKSPEKEAKILHQKTEPGYSFLTVSHHSSFQRRLSVPSLMLEDTNPVKTKKSSSRRFGESLLINQD